MTVWELYKKLGRYPVDMEVHIGCEGYSTLMKPKDEYQIKVYGEGDWLMITDGCGDY